MPEISLYDRLGGATGITSLVDDFYRRVLGDPDLGSFFAGANLERLQHMQRQFFAAALGGPVVYAGRPIAHAHHHLKITLAAYQRFVQHLFATLASIELDDRECYEIVGRLNLYTEDVVSTGTGLIG